MGRHAGTLNPFIDQLPQLLVIAMLMVRLQTLQVKKCFLIEEVIYPAALLVPNRQRLIRNRLQGMPLFVAKFDVHTFIVP